MRTIPQAPAPRSHPAVYVVFQQPHTVLISSVVSTISWSPKPRMCERFLKRLWIFSFAPWPHSVNPSVHSFRPKAEHVRKASSQDDDRHWRHKMHSGCLHYVVRCIMQIMGNYSFKAKYLCFTLPICSCTPQVRWGNRFCFTSTCCSCRLRFNSQTLCRITNIRKQTVKHTSTLIHKYLNLFDGVTFAGSYFCVINAFKPF